MKINSIEIASLALFIILVSGGTAIIYKGYRNYQGYCHKTNEKVSEQKKIINSVDTFLKFYPKDEKAFSTRMNREMNTSNIIYYPIAYANADDFKAKNPDCCTVIRQPDDIEDASTTFMDRIFGSKESFVKIKYILRYRTSLAPYLERTQTVTYAVNNCGTVWNGA